ncbi:response regulator [Paucibacter soli]|uniref:response regulator n=1 Tax=Paucibacter soli TaxID=3133433 RepID=UPI0030A4F368
MVTSVKREEFSFLVVDDFSTMRRIISGLLREIGFRKILEAENGRDALRQLELSVESGDAIHFVLSDVNMPEMNGFQLLEAIKAKPAEDPVRKIPVLLVTAEGRKDDIIRAAQGGACGYVVKPFNKETLADKIHLTLKHRGILVE